MRDPKGTSYEVIKLDYRLERRLDLLKVCMSESVGLQ